MKMAPGFFAKLGEIAKKVYNTGKKIVKGVAKYGVPLAKGMAQGFGMMGTPQTKAISTGINSGLSTFEPILSRLMDA